MVVALLMMDLDNTVVDRDVAFSWWLDSKAAIDSRFLRERAWICDQDQGGFRPREQFFAALRERFSLSTALDDLLAEYRLVTTAGFPPVPLTTLRRIDAARASGISVAIVTNGDEAAQRATAIATGLLAHVDALVISAAVGVAKPNRRIFEIAARRCGEGDVVGAWMIGDARADVLGGRACQAQTVWLGEDEPGTRQTFAPTTRPTPSTRPWTYQSRRSPPTRGNRCSEKTARKGPPPVFVRSSGSVRRAGLSAGPDELRAGPAGCAWAAGAGQLAASRASMSTASVGPVGVRV